MVTARQRPPLHPGEVLADALEGMHVSLRQAAKAIGMSPNGLHKVLTGKGPLTADTALRVGTWLGNGPEIWLRLQVDYDLWHARRRLKGELAKIAPAERDAA